MDITYRQTPVTDTAANSEVLGFPTADTVTHRAARRAPRSSPSAGCRPCMAAPRLPCTGRDRRQRPALLPGLPGTLGAAKAGSGARNRAGPRLGPGAQPLSPRGPSAARSGHSSALPGLPPGRAHRPPRAHPAAGAGGRAGAQLPGAPTCGPARRGPRGGGCQGRRAGRSGSPGPPGAGLRAGLRLRLRLRALHPGRSEPRLRARPQPRCLGPALALVSPSCCSQSYTAIRVHQVTISW